MRREGFAELFARHVGTIVRMADGAGCGLVKHYLSGWEMDDAAVFCLRGLRNTTMGAGSGAKTVGNARQLLCLGVLPTTLRMRRNCADDLGHLANDYDRASRQVQFMFISAYCTVLLNSSNSNFANTLSAAVSLS